MSAKSTKKPKVEKAEAVESPKPIVAKKAPKPIDFPAGEPRPVRVGTKLHTLIETIGRPEGATLEEIATALSQTGSKVNPAMAKSWITYDARHAGYGAQQDVSGRIHLVLPAGMDSPPEYIDRTADKVSAVMEEQHQEQIEREERLTKKKKAALTPPKAKKSTKSKVA